MHECPKCGEPCECDGQEAYQELPPLDGCTHVCETEECPPKEEAATASLATVVGDAVLVALWLWRVAQNNRHTHS